MSCNTSIYFINLIPAEQEPRPYAEYADYCNG